MKGVLEKILSDDDRKLVYHLSDGVNTSRTIAAKTPVSHNTVSVWWKAWFNMAIIDNIPVQGGGTRGKKVFNLEDFDIPIPKLPEKNAEEKQAE
ncbi:MAG: hypothetical protein ABIJ47_12660 [Candidatus Bathyarchaeota archaeon]